MGEIKGCEESERGGEREREGGGREREEGRERERREREPTPSVLQRKHLAFELFFCLHLTHQTLSQMHGIL